MTSQERVLIEIDGHIARVFLNRPEKHNGLDLRMFQELIAAAKTIRKNRDVRAVILSGKGESFCAGLDFASVTRKPGTVARIFLKLPFTKTNVVQRVAMCWYDMPVPVIAAVHGHCFGGGLQIALAADFRIAAPNSDLSVMEIKWGIIPDMSATVTLSKLVRMDIAKELTMTGRRVTGAEALELGLVTRVADDPLAFAERLAQEIIEKSPDATAATKYLYRKAWHTAPRRALFWERLTQMRILGRKNQRIAMKNAARKDEKLPFHNRKTFR